MPSNAVDKGLLEFAEEFLSEGIVRFIFDWWYKFKNKSASPSTSTGTNTSTTSSAEAANLSESALGDAIASFWGAPGIKTEARQKINRELRRIGNPIRDRFERAFGERIFKGLKTGIWLNTGEKVIEHSKKPGQKQKDGKPGAPEEFTRTTERNSQPTGWDSPTLFVNMVNTAGESEENVREFIEWVLHDRVWDDAGNIIVKATNEVAKPLRWIIFTLGIGYIASVVIATIIAWYNLSNFTDQPEHVVSLVWGAIGFFTAAGLLWFVLRNFIPENN